MHLFEVREYVSNDNQQIYIGTLNIDRHSCANTSANCRRIYRFRYTASPAPPGLQLITPVHHSICYPAIPYPLGSIHGNMLCCAVPVLDCTRCARGKTMFSAHRTNHWKVCTCHKQHDCDSVGCSIFRGFNVQLPTCEMQ